jgi:CHAT domain-containing protein
MQTVSTIGLDIAKSVFQVHGVDANGLVVIRRQLKRRYVLAFFEKLPSCLVGIEACASSHHWSRELRALGHNVRLMPPAYVKPYVKRQKNDMADAEAICEAVTRANMRFVPIKTPEQQSGLVLHRTRHLFIRQQTSVINAIRARVGPLLATALVASVADPKAFRSGRNFSAWIGLVPKQHSSGGRDKLGSISKQGDRHLRSLFVAGALAVIRYGRGQYENRAVRLDIELQEREVKPGGRLIWLPAGALGFLPLGLAHDASTGRLFADIYEITQAPSLEALVFATQHLVTTSPASLVAVVNPTGDIPKLDLPFAEIEGALVTSHFDGDQLILLDESNATPAAVLAALRGKTYWHFSTHGSFNWKDVRQSAILMKGNAPLTVGALRETEGSLGRPRLVVLSACESGLHDITRSPDEFVGMPATLMQIGAVGVLGTLWQVDDLATALFISKFYDLHIDDGLAPVSALQRAQIWFRQATKAEVLAYSKAAVAHAKLNTSALAAIEASLKSRRRSSATIFAAIWDTLQEKIASTLRDSAPDEENLQSPPFEHPYYWGGFVYTGG